MSELFAALDRCGGVPNVSDLQRCLGAKNLGMVDVLPHADGDRSTYVRTLVHRTDRYQVFVMCWMPGQRSPAHDHGGAACAVRVFHGVATEIDYEIAADGYAEPTGQRVYRSGDVLGAADDDVHVLGNLLVPGASAPSVLVTLHVYAPELGHCRKYAERPAARRQPVLPDRTLVHHRQNAL